MRCVSVRDARTRCEHDRAVEGAGVAVADGDAAVAVGVTLSDGVTVGELGLATVVGLAEVDGGGVDCAQAATMMVRTAATTARGGSGRPLVCTFPRRRPRR